MAGTFIIILILASMYFPISWIDKYGISKLEKFLIALCGIIGMIFIGYRFVYTTNDYISQSNWIVIFLCCTAPVVWILGIKLYITKVIPENKRMAEIEKKTQEWLDSFK